MVAAPRQRRVLACVAVGMFLLTWVCWRPFRPEPCVVFLDVGHGDAAFIRTPGGDTLLVDGGDARSPLNDMGARVVAPFLWSQYTDHLDYVVLSHADQDHIGGLFYVLEHLRVDELVLGPELLQHPAERALLERCAAHKVRVRRVYGGQTVPLRGATMTVCHPPADWDAQDDTNEASLVVRLCWPGLDVLFTGDVEARAETALVASPQHSTVLKAPHHGSRTSSSPAFVAAVHPALCIVSTGGSHGREAVAEEVLARYRADGARVLRTDLSGGITLTVEHGALVTTGARAQRGYPERPVFAADVPD